MVDKAGTGEGAVREALREARSALTDRECRRELKNPPEVVACAAAGGDVTGIGGVAGRGWGLPIGDVSLDGLASGTDGEGGGEPRGTSVVVPFGNDAFSTNIGILGDGGPL